MDRRVRDFLMGLDRAVLPARRGAAHPPSYTRATECLLDFCHLHADSDDLVWCGLAVGCPSGLGKG